ncbi:MAG: glycosyltransferase family 4 protein [Planctomycetota bacterium]
MRVLLLNQPYAPDNSATAQHCEDLARYLVDRGHEVAVIASRSIYGESGAKLPRREDRDGVEVHRVGLSLFGKRGIVLRAIDFGLFYAAATLKALRIRRPDVVVTLTTPPFIAAVGGLLKRLRGCAHVYWAMDLYPDVLVAAGISSDDALHIRLLERLNRRCLRRADRVVVLGRCMEARVRGKSIPPRGVATIGVWPANPPRAAADRPLASTYRDTWDLHGRFVVQYAGNFGLAHDVETICHAMRRLRDRDDLRFVFVGGGKRIAAVRNFAAEHGLPNVVFYPYQPREKLDDLLRLADVHLISQARAFTGIVVPSKLYGIMAAGRGALFVGPAETEVAHILHEARAGQAFAIGRDQALAETIRDLAADPARARAWGQHALQAVAESHTAHHRCAAWESLLLETTRPPRTDNFPVTPAGVGERPRQTSGQIQPDRRVP